MTEFSELTELHFRFGFLQLPVLRLNLVSRLRFHGLGNDCWLNFIMQSFPCCTHAPYKQRTLSAEGSISAILAHTMTSADFSQFVVTAGFPVCEISPSTHTFFLPYTRRIYCSQSVQLLGFDLFSSLALAYSLIGDFCSSGQRFAFGRDLSTLPLLASFRFHLTMDTLAFG